MARSERLTAIASTLVAVAILAGGVRAYQAKTAPVDDVVQLESDLRFQLEVGFMHDHRERGARLKQMHQVTAAWHNSQQTDADRAQLADWLLEATIRSMPGSVQTLPPIPKFGRSQIDVLLDNETAPVVPEDVLIDAKVEEEFEPAAIAPVPAAETSVTPTATALPRQTKPFVGSQSEAARTRTETPVTYTRRPQQRAADTASADEADLQQSAPVSLPIQVNLSELVARITGYHTGLDAVERALATMRPGDFDSLAEQIHELEQLTRDYQFIYMYYQSLSATERRWVTEPRQVTQTLAGLQRRIDEAQETLVGDFLNEFDTSNPERLGVLRQQAAELASRLDR